MRRGTRTFVAVVLAFVILAWPPRVWAQGVTGDEVRFAIRAGIRYLRESQHPRGSWRDLQWPGGTTALAILALRNAGVPANDPDIQRAVAHLVSVPNQHTYVVSLKAQALAAVDPVRYRREIEGAAAWLVNAQRDESGLWGYALNDATWDHSNTQFALLGLHEAARAGARVPERTWRRAESEWLRTQLRDGGWTYKGREGTSTGSMTGAGVASLYITGNRLETTRERGYSPAGRAPNCGTYSENAAIAHGIAWLSRRFDPARNPGMPTYYYYYLYGVERVGLLSGLRFFGNHDWYREGAAQLIRRQRDNGAWREMDSVADTSFALLFLAKGHRSLLFNKLKWCNDDRWNQDRHDLENLVAAIGDTLGEPVAWQVVDLRAPLEEWLAAPILYFNGHEFPTLTGNHEKQFAEFVKQGGSLVAEACCSRREFREGFERFAKNVFPETPLRPLAPEHPVYHAIHELDDRPELLGIDVGCRTSVIFIPKDVSCLWEQADVPLLSERAFQLGTNIAAYLTGRQKLPDRLDAVHVVREAKDEAPAPPAALYVAQLQYEGDWRPDAKAMANLATFLREKADVDVVPKARPVAVVDATLLQHPIAFVTGHYAFTLSDAEMQALRTYLLRGGFLFADACCGRKAFDASFRAMVAKLLPDHKLERLAATHSILSGELGFKLDRVDYRPAVLAETPDAIEPVLEAVTIDGRCVVVYSPYAIGCPIDGHACFGCRGLEPESARKLAANIVLYALSY